MSRQNAMELMMIDPAVRSNTAQRYRQALTDRPVLHTVRLALRKPEQRDIGAIIDIAGDWEVASRLARMPHPYSEAHARFFLDTIVPVELVWVMVEKTMRRVVGVIGLTFDENTCKAELGYYVAHDQWGLGLATEAGSVVVAYGIGLIGRDRLTSGFFADNPASGRVLEKLGFVEHALSQRPCLARGAPKASVEVGLSRTTEL